MGKCSKDEQRKRRLKRQQVVRKGSEDTARIRDTYPATIVKHRFAPPAARSKGDRAGIAIDFHHGAIGIIHVSKGEAATMRPSFCAGRRL
jgi:hypothetical protein